MSRGSLFSKACGIAAGAVCTLALTVAPAQAVPILVIDFDNIALDGGVVTATSGGNYTGTNIVFDSIFLRTIDSITGNTIQTFAGVQCGNDTSGGTLSEACTLDFDTATGAFTVTADGGLYDIGADLLPFTSDRGNLVLASGGIVVNGNLGDFDFNSTVVNIPFVGSITLGTFVGTGTDTKNAALLTFFGLTNSQFVFANTEITVGAGGAVVEADLVNFPISVPEPGSLSLLGLGLLVAGRAFRRRHRKA